MRPLHQLQFCTQCGNQQIFGSLVPWFDGGVVSASFYPLSAGLKPKVLSVAATPSFGISSENTFDFCHQISHGLKFFCLSSLTELHVRIIHSVGRRVRLPPRLIFSSSIGRKLVYSSNMLLRVSFIINKH